MNFVAISPHFPPNYRLFWKHLKELGVTVLGLGDAPYHELDPELLAYLADYYRVGNMLNYDEMVRALGFLTHKYGKIDRLESHNEFWLETDAALRSDFNIPGFHRGDMQKVKRKSAMKKVYQDCGVNVARGLVAQNIEEAKALIAEVGYPVVAKPDVGVGAAMTYLLAQEEELEYFFRTRQPLDFILEEFIQGQIVTYDGLVDQDGKVVFDSSLRYSDGVMESVTQSVDMWYYIEREVPADLREAGQKLIQAYGLKERFFHFEFFRLESGLLCGLEMNMRPPGGMTIDMWDFANDIDIYREYANVVVNNRFSAELTRPYYCAYVSRRFGKQYQFSIDEVLNEYREQVVHHEFISGVFAPALGDYGFLVRAKTLDEVRNIVSWIFRKRENIIL